MAFGVGERPFVDDMPALWMTASIRPMAFTWTAMPRLAEPQEAHLTGLSASLPPE